MSFDETPEFLLPELHAIIQNMVRQSGTGWEGVRQRARMRLVSRAWRARDNDFRWHKNHPDLPFVDAARRADLDFLCDELLALPFPVPCPECVDPSGGVWWGWEGWHPTENLFYIHSEYHAHNFRDSHERLEKIGPLFSWWPGRLALIKSKLDVIVGNVVTYAVYLQLPMMEILRPLIEQYDIKGFVSYSTLLGNIEHGDLVLQSPCNDSVAALTSLTLTIDEVTGACERVAW